MKKLSNSQLTRVQGGDQRNCLLLGFAIGFGGLGAIANPALGALIVGPAFFEAAGNGCF